MKIFLNICCLILEKLIKLDHECNELKQFSILQRWIFCESEFPFRVSIDNETKLLDWCLKDIYFIIGLTTTSTAGDQILNRYVIHLLQFTLKIRNLCNDNLAMLNVLLLFFNYPIRSFRPLKLFNSNIKV